MMFWSEIFCVFQGGQKVRKHFGLSSSFLNKWIEHISSSQYLGSSFARPSCLLRRGHRPSR